MYEKKDTVGNFDDVPNAFPRWCQVSFVSQANFISLHQSHICRKGNGETHVKNTSN